MVLEELKNFQVEDLFWKGNFKMDYYMDMVIKY